MAKWRRSLGGESSICSMTRWKAWGEARSEAGTTAPVTMVMANIDDKGDGNAYFELQDQ